MGRQSIFFFTMACIFATNNAFAQSSQYKRKKKEAPVAAESSSAPGTAAVAPAGASAPPSGKDEKLDVTGLEEKYWSSQDTDFTVVQNRTYSKVKRFSAGLSAGMPSNDSYNTGLFYNLSANYYWSERHGVEFNYTQFDLKDSKLIDDFEGQHNGLRPDSNRDKSFMGVSYNFVPIYAKASLLGSKILYFDFGVSPGLGLVSYEQLIDTGNTSDSAVAYTLDFTQQFFISKNFAFRFDFKNRWSKQKVKGYSGATRGREIRDDMVNSSFLVFGITFFF